MVQNWLGWGLAGDDARSDGAGRWDRLSTRSGLLGPLRERDFRLLVTGALVSLLGDGFFRVAIGIQVLLIANRAGALAAVAAVWALGQIIALPLGGWAGDRYERRRVMVLADLWRGAAIGTLGVLSLTGALELWHLLVLGGAFGLGNGFFNPSSTALLPELLPPAELARANAVLGVARQAMLWIVGPLLGGLFVSALGSGAAFVVDAGTFALSALLLARMARRPVVVTASRPALVASIAEGLGYVKDQPWAWAWFAGTAVSTLAWHGPFDVLVPFLLRNDLGYTEGQVSQTMAAIFTAGGTGAIAAALLIGRWDLPRRFMTVLYCGEATAVAALVGFGLMTAGWQGVLAGGVLFTLFAVTEIVWTTTMQRLVPADLLGRVSAVDWFASVSLAPISFIVAWVLHAAMGTRAALVVAGLAGAVLVLGLLAVPGARAPEQARLSST